jgi:hypothetical protein
VKKRLADRVQAWGALAFCIFLTGCARTTGNPAPPLAATSAYLWGDNVPNYSGGPPQTILKYSTVSPTSSPIGTLTVPSTCNGGSIAEDADGQLYVACFSAPSSPLILVYPPNPTGAATPSRTIELSSSSYEIATLTTDASGRLYVGSLLRNTEVPQFVVSIYAAGANGMAILLGTIELAPNNGLNDVAVDGAGNIYVDGYSSVDGPPDSGAPVSFVNVYSATNLAQPVRMINFPFFTSGVGVDALGNIFVSAAVENAGNVSAVEEYAPDASGYASPTNTIKIPAQPAGTEVGGGPVRFDRAGNMFTAVLLGNPQPTTYILYRFGLPASGHAVPVAEIDPKNGYNTAFALN